MKPINKLQIHTEAKPLSTEAKLPILEKKALSLNQLKRGVAMDSLDSPSNTLIPSITSITVIPPNSKTLLSFALNTSISINTLNASSTNTLVTSALDCSSSSKTFKSFATNTLNSSSTNTLCTPSSANIFENSSTSSFTPFINNNIKNQSPRMRRLASKLSVIQISLDPPSPPRIASLGDFVDFYPDHIHHENLYMEKFHRVDDAFLLQVPRGSIGGMSDWDLGSQDLPRQCSPPPRRSSYTSTMTNSSTNEECGPNSSLFSLTNSYQSLLLSPLSGVSNAEGGILQRQRSSASSSYSRENTPPEFVYHQQMYENSARRSFSVLVWYF